MKKPIESNIYEMTDLCEKLKLTPTMEYDIYTKLWRIEINSERVVEPVLSCEDDLDVALDKITDDLIKLKGK